MHYTCGVGHPYFYTLLHGIHYSWVHLEAKEVVLFEHSNCRHRIQQQRWDKVCGSCTKTEASSISTWVLMIVFTSAARKKS